MSGAESGTSLGTPPSWAGSPEAASAVRCAAHLARISSRASLLSASPTLPFAFILEMSYMVEATVALTRGSMIAALSAKPP